MWDEIQTPFDLFFKNQMHGAGNNGGYRMYAYLQCEFATKSILYKPSFLCFLYLQVIINQ